MKESQFGQKYFRNMDWSNISDIILNKNKSFCDIAQSRKQHTNSKLNIDKKFFGYQSRSLCWNSRYESKYEVQQNNLESRNNLNPKIINSNEQEKICIQMNFSCFGKLSGSQPKKNQTLLNFLTKQYQDKKKKKKIINYQNRVVQYHTKKQCCSVQCVEDKSDQLKVSQKLVEKDQRKGQKRSSMLLIRSQQFIQRLKVKTSKSILIIEPILNPKIPTKAEMKYEEYEEFDDKLKIESLKQIPSMESSLNNISIGFVKQNDEIDEQNNQNMEVPLRIAEKPQRFPPVLNNQIQDKSQKELKKQEIILKINKNIQLTSLTNKIQNQNQNQKNIKPEGNFKFHTQMTSPRSFRIRNLLSNDSKQQLKQQLNLLPLDQILNRSKFKGGKLRIITPVFKHINDQSNSKKILTNQDSINKKEQSTKFQQYIHKLKPQKYNIP